MQRWTIALVLACSLAVAASAERYWEGNAAQLSGDSTFSAGAFAASNSFAPGTDVVVLDPDTGISTTVQVVQRIDGRSDMLILLSPPAAKALGIEPGESVRVRVTIQPPVAPRSLAADTGQSVDAEVGAPAAPPAASEPQIAEAAPEVTVEPSAAEPPAVAPPAAEATTPAADDEAMLAELANRSPQKILSLPPREDELFAYREPAEGATAAEAPAPEVAEATPVPEEQPPIPEELPPALSGRAPEVASVDGTPAQTGPGPEPALAEAPPPKQQVPQAESPLAVSPRTGTQIAAGSLPAPEVAPAAAVAPAAPPQTAVATAATGRAAPQQALRVPAAPAKAGAYYVQLAAYNDEIMARAAATSLAKTWPAVVLEPEAGAARIFRLVLGPLNRAESGTLLHRFQHDGYPDAFVRAP